MPPLPSFRQIGYLLALHEAGHFGRAAAACFVTQSTLSVGIAELERLLGAQLVERSKRSVRFTEAGEEVIVRARVVMRAADDLLAVTQATRDPLTGALRLAAIPTIAPFLLPRLLPAVERDWPRLQLFVREMLTGAACEALALGAIDCVLLALPVECGPVETAGIGSDRLLLATRDDDPTAGEPDVSRLLLLEDGHCLKDQALAACDPTRRAADPQLVASTLHTLVQLVDAGLGITLVPEMAVESGILAGTRVRVRPLDGLDATRRIALAWRQDHPRAREFQLLAETIRAAARLPAD